jgi:hypothetical protein
MKKSYRSFFILFLLPLFVASELPGQNLYKTNSYEIGLSYGKFFSGTVTVSKDGIDTDLKKKDGYIGQIFFDIVLNRHSSFGVFLNYSNLDFEGDSVKVTMSDFGAKYKYRLLLNKRFAIHPGIGIGYRNLDSTTPIIDSAGLSVNLSVEFIYAVTQSNIKVFADTGLLSEPFGKADDYDVRFYAHPYLNLGIAF